VPAIGKPVLFRAVDVLAALIAAGRGIDLLLQHDGVVRRSIRRA
jgi:hypothetical protein